MRYGDDDRQSENVEDRRGQGGGGGFSGGGFPMLGGGGLSITSLLVIGGVCLLLGINPLTLLSSGGIEIPHMPRPDVSQRAPSDAQGLPGQKGVLTTNDEMTKFVRRVLADTEDVWDRVFQAAGKRYEKPTLVLFSGATRTECGVGRTAMGPFYCPVDRKVYIDLSFYEELKRRFNAPGDFAQAYVIAHEVGHHVQTLLGIADKVQAMKARGGEVQANALQVRMELQADCLAGVWANLTNQLKGRLQPGDIESGLNAAAAIGDDRLQKQAQGHVVPESFTHGTSAQRVKWFRTGLDTGQTKACDTFNTSTL